MADDSTSFVVRELNTPAEMAALQALEKQIWGGNDVAGLPLHLLIAIARNGGIVLGAFDGERLVGFALGFIGLDKGAADRVAASRLKFASHQMGVHPDYRRQRVAQRLKFAQLEYAQRLGIRLITWTYDPLQSVNARLNIARLGGIVREYHRDYYGDLGDALNQGLPTDRVVVEWWLTTARVRQRMKKDGRKPLTLEQYRSGGIAVANPVQYNAAGLLTPTNYLDIAAKPLLLVEIPADFATLKQADVVLAKQWREHIRRVFEELFAVGFIVTDFLLNTQAGDTRAYYLLSQGNASFGGT